VAFEMYGLVAYFSDRCSGRAVRSKMQTQNSVKLGNGLPQVLGTVWARNNKLGFRSIEMRAPIRNYPIGAVRRIAFAAVTDD
jgi:hypothetical protein